MKRILIGFLVIAVGILLVDCQNPLVDGQIGNAQSRQVDGQTNSSKKIISFGFTVPLVSGIIDQSSNTISVTVPIGTAIAALVPTIVHNGKSINPASGTAPNFTNRVKYTVTAIDGSTRGYWVTVKSTLAPPTKAITSFTFASPAATGVINETAHTIAVAVPSGTNLTSLTPTIVHDGVSIKPASGTAHNFSSPVTYTVTASNGTTQGYVVTVTPLVKSPDVQVVVNQPRNLDNEGDSVAFVVIVTSTYQIQSVTASVHATSVNLTLASGRWTGTLSLAGQPMGPNQVLITATDVFSHCTQVARDLYYDQKPVVIVTSPLDASVALPTADIRAACTDDDPNGPVSLTLTVNGAVISSGKSSISQTVDFSKYSGQKITLNFEGVDSHNQKTDVTRMLYVESSAALAFFGTVPGSVWDVAGNRILYLDTTGVTPSLNVTNIQTGITRTIETNADLAKEKSYGFLTPLGAIYVRQGSGNPMINPSGLYEWSSSSDTVAALASIVTVSLKVAGGWAIYVDALENLYERNLNSGTTTLVASNAPTSLAIQTNDVATNGSVVYSTLIYGEIGHDVYRFFKGSTQTITSAVDPTLERSGPVTDGTNVLYWKQSSNLATYGIVLYDGTTNTDLAPTTGPARGNLTYLVTGGQVAYTALDSSSNLQVWRHTGAGEQQVTFFGSSSKLESVGADGTILLTKSTNRYRALVGQAPERIGSSYGRIIYRNGEFLIIIGSTVLRVK